MEHWESDHVTLGDKLSQPIGASVIRFLVAVVLGRKILCPNFRG